MSRVYILWQWRWIKYWLHCRSLIALVLMEWVFLSWLFALCVYYEMNGSIVSVKLYLWCSFLFSVGLMMQEKKWNSVINNTMAASYKCGRKVQCCSLPYLTPVISMVFPFHCCDKDISFYTERKEEKKSYLTREHECQHNKCFLIVLKKNIWYWQL